MKQCSKCKMNKEKTLFSKDKARLDGLTSWCKECRRSNYLSKRLETLEQQKQYNLQNKNVRRSYGAKYYQANKEKVLKRSKENYLKNKDAIKIRHREYNKQYLIDFPEMNLAKTQRRRARKYSNGVFTIRKSELTRLYNSQCLYCNSKRAEHLDHVIPLVKGGRHSIGNLVPACSECNMSKGSKLLSVWKRDRKW